MKLISVLFISFFIPLFDAFGEDKHGFKELLFLNDSFAREISRFDEEMSKEFNRPQAWPPEPYIESPFKELSDNVFKISIQGSVNHGIYYVKIGDIDSYENAPFGMKRLFDSFLCLGEKVENGVYAIDFFEIKTKRCGISTRIDSDYFEHMSYLNFAPKWCPDTKRPTTVRPQLGNMGVARYSFCKKWLSENPGARPPCPYKEPTRTPASEGTLTLSCTKVGNCCERFKDIEPVYEKENFENSSIHKFDTTAK